MMLGPSNTCGRSAALAALFALALAGLPTGTAAQVPQANCPPLVIGGTTWDYLVDRQFIDLVEKAHFTLEVEMLLHGHSTEKVGPDIDYTLHRFPNHHRALLSLIRMQERQMRESAVALPQAKECYFVQAVQFRPKDSVVRMLYAKFLTGQSRIDDARVQLKAAVAAQPDNALTQRAAGLLYLELKDFDNARTQAWAAQRLEPTETRVRDQLQRLGEWREPPPAPPAASAPAATASAAAQPAAVAPMVE